MPEPTTFESRLADAFDRYTDAAPRRVDARVLAAELAAGGRGRHLTLPRLAPHFGGLRLANALGLLAVASVAGLLFAGGFLTPEPAPLGGGGRILVQLTDDDRTHLFGADGTIRASATMQSRGCPQLLGNVDAVNLGGFVANTFRSFDAHLFPSFSGQGQYRQLTNYAGFEVWSGDRGSRAFVDTAAGASVVTFRDGDVANPHIDWYPIVGASGGALSPSGDVLALAVPDGPRALLVHLLGGGTDRIIAGLPVDDPEAWASISWSPDGSRFVVSTPTPGDRGLTLVTPSDGSVRNAGHPDLASRSSLHVPAGAWSPDGGSIVAMTDTGKLEVIDLDEGVHQLLPFLVGPAISAVRWSPDGTSLAVVAEWRGWPARQAVTIYPLDGSEPRVVELPGTTGESSEMAWSPDGTMLLTVDTAGPVKGRTGDAARLWATDVWGDAQSRSIASVPQAAHFSLRGLGAPCLEWLPEVQP
ncbi:MAG: WD40 repeat domain-containing protein [Chloroflexi bacterium]|nr:WD40 repeat domain-containing protein [Chloroflexota bacterium]